MADLPTRSSRELAERQDDSETVWAVLHSTVRSGRWEPPESMRLVSAMGSIVLDFRDADLLLGVTELDCMVVMGSVEVVVPDDVDVELSGYVLMGSVETKNEGGGTWRRVRERLLGDAAGVEAPGDDEEERPLLRIHCRGTMGSVEVKLA